MEPPVSTTAPEGLTQLVYELLDAHGDTMTLARPLADSPEWQAHLAYLRDLQRVGRELLASESTTPAPGSLP